MAEQLFIGVMSGTSMDGIDTVLASFDGQNVDTLDSYSSDFSPSLKSQLKSLCLPGDNEIDRACAASVELGQAIASCVNTLLEKSGTPADTVNAIGSHGQTIRHRPDSDKAFSLQIGDPSTIAHLTGITTICDFRMADIAAKGQGAPLVPAFHQAVFASRSERRIILNIGGIANISVTSALESSSGIETGYDTGPGNILMDAWIQETKSLDFDNNGDWAASGTLVTPLLTKLLSEPFIDLSPPKSTGRELFNLAWLKGKIGKELHSAEDIQRTLTEFTACSIAKSIKTSTEHQGCEIFVCGGGIRNKLLMSRLNALLPYYSIKSTQDIGIDPQLVEASAFAWLAKQTLSGLPGNAKQVTGAQHEKILGGIYPA